MKAPKDRKDKPTGQTLRPAVLADCGRVSQRTRGVPYLVWLEVGVPPNDTLLYP